ncbi:MAG: hypothetical protein ACPGED_04230, partial [Flavobacteriales bacterium]
PYSSDIVVAGAPVAIENMSVTLTGVTHTFPSDMDVMLVAPNGDNFIFMSDAIGGNDIVAVDFTFADFAASALDATTLTSGVYQPTNVGAGDVLPGVAPLDQGNVSLVGAFGGDDANGTWTIFVADDAGGDAGDITGWEISFFPDVVGCTDGATPACNYDPLATLDSGLCDYSCVGCTDDGLGTIVPAVFPGTAACDYDPLATIDNGACDYSCFGCTDPAALNTTPGATNDDGSCVTPGCIDAPVNFQLCYADNSTTSLTLTENNPGEGVTLEFLAGTVEVTWDDLNIYDGPDNLSPLLVNADGDVTGLYAQSTGASITIELIGDVSSSCASGAQTEMDINAYCTTVVLGCTDDGSAGPFAPDAACNYDPLALNDDGSCEYDSCSGCTDPAATNYSGVGATIDDGSCITCGVGELLVTVDMRDSFGDGWNGHEYILSDGGGIIGQNDLDNATVGDGTDIGFDLYCLAPGCYQFDILVGSFTGEIGYTVSDNIGNTYLDVDGAAVTGQGLNIGTGNACGFNGCTDPTAINYDINADVDDASCLYPPANDEICNAEALACGSSILGTTALSTDAEALVGSTCSGIDITSSGVWYEFNPLTDQQIFLSACGSTSGIDTKIHVYEAADCLSALNCVAGNDDGCGAGVFTSEVVFNASTGSNYFIYVSEFGTGNGLEFNLDVTCVDCVSGVPGNDDCANATPVPAIVAGVEATATQSICCASAAVENDFAPAFSTTYDVWFLVNSGTFDALAISLRNVDNALVGITIYDGSDCLALNSAAGGGPVVGEIAGDLSDFVTVTPATDYLIQAWTTDPAGCGDITLGVTGNNLGCTDAAAINFDPLATLDDGSCDYTGVTPANDECANAATLVCNTTVSGSTGGATALGAPLGIAGCNATPGTGVWYTFVGTGELHTLTTCGSVIDSQINVYESDADCAGVFTCMASATEGFVECGFFDQDDVQVQFISVPGLNYYIYVGAEDVDADPLTDDDGLFDLTFDCVVAAPGCTEPNA